jgi:hypothetical protein
MNYDWLGLYDQIMVYVHTLTLMTLACLITGAALGYMTRSSGTMRKCILAIIVLLIVAGVLRGGYGIDILPVKEVADFFASLFTW